MASAAFHHGARKVARVVLAIAAGLATFAALMAFCDTEPAPSPPASTSPAPH